MSVLGHNTGSSETFMHDMSQAARTRQTVLNADRIDSESRLTNQRQSERDVGSYNDAILGRLDGKSDRNPIGCRSARFRSDPSSAQRHARVPAKSLSCGLRPTIRAA